MLKATASQARRLPRRLRRVWSELDYAQRRAFEIRTGIPLGPEKRPRISRTIDELERLFAA
jgi:hypothetical protein